MIMIDEDSIIVLGILVLILMVIPFFSGFFFWLFYRTSDQFLWGCFVGVAIGLGGLCYSLRNTEEIYKDVKSS